MGESYGKTVKIAIGRAQTQQPISHITKRMKNSQGGTQRGQGLMSYLIWATAHQDLTPTPFGLTNLSLYQD